MNKFDIIDTFTDLASEVGDKFSELVDNIKEGNFEINLKKEKSEPEKRDPFKKMEPSKERSSFSEKAKDVAYDLGDAIENLGSIIKNKIK